MATTPDFLADYQAFTAGCGFAELPRTVIEVRGNDRSQFLHSFCTNDVKKLAPGQGCEAFITSHQGKTLGHVFIFCESERLVIGTVADQAASLIGHFDKFVISEDVTFQGLSDRVQIYLVTGKTAAAKLRELSGSEPPAEMLAFLQAKIAGCDCTVFRVPYTGAESFFIRVAVGEAPAVRAALEAAGARPCSEEAIETLRLEAGFPYFGRDITDETLPQEVARDKQAISFTKGCYLGQETVARIDAVGHVNRLLARVRFEQDQIPAEGTPLLVAGKQVGQTTSAAWSPAIGSPLAMAYLRRAHAASGTRLESDFGACEVIAPPAG
jgi:folate-binding protein YgfZ